jgi:hypothetical protein
VTRAADIDALRVAFARVFEYFIYDAAAGRDASLIPVVRDTARTEVYEFEVDGQAHSIRYPAKTPLPYTANKEAFSLAYESLFAPIPVRADPK